MPSVRDRLLSHRSKIHPVTVPGVDGEFYLRVMTLGETLEVSKIAETREKEHKSNLEPLLVKTLCEADGTRLFKDGEEDVLTAQVEFPIIRFLYDEAVKINEKKKTLPELADAAKN